MTVNVLSFDFGASNGRAVLGKYDGTYLSVEEVHRFENNPITINGTLCWDIDTLLLEVTRTLQKVCQTTDISSIAIDTWGVDFGLLDEEGKLIGTPVHYRDSRTDGMVKEVMEMIPLEELYKLTGNQIIFFNTIFQLAYLKKYEPETLDKATSLLLMPDLFNYLLTGEKRAEETIASTTQMFDPYKKIWNKKVIDKLNMPFGIFQEVIRPGETVGNISGALADKLSIPQIPVVATTSHDTAGAVVSVPAPEHDFLFVSCGTWSLIGTELQNPIVSEQSSTYNITNESGINGTTRFLKNVTGLWILQELKKQFQQEGKKYTYDTITKYAEEAKEFKCIIDVDDALFQHPGDMADKIKIYAEKANQPIPETDGEIFRTIYESLALKYREVFDEVMDCVGKNYEKVHIVGGGSQAAILCQMVADASGKEVVAGPVEATVIGNCLVQMLAQNMVKDVAEARGVVHRSFDVKVYQPNKDERWDDQYSQYKSILSRMKELERAT